MAELISLETAGEKVKRAGAGQRRIESEAVALGDSLARVLARDCLSTQPWPPTDRAAMDGFALAAGEGGLAAGTSYRVCGASLAGHPHEGSIPDGEAIRIMTGAVVPESLDAVVPVEETSGYAAEGCEVTLQADVAKGQHVRLQGSELAAGQRVLAAGTRIRPAEVLALAALGADKVQVYARPRVAILATGDEVVPIDSEPAAHQVRDCNAQALAAQVRQAGGEPLLLGIAPDREKELRAALERGLECGDVLLTIGGVSKGTHDLVHRLLAELAVEPLFHGIALKPGKPTFFGRLRGAETGGLVFGLPGNPVSCCTVFELLVAPLLRQLGGEKEPERGVEGYPARVAGTPFKRNWRLQAIPASVRVDPEGRLLAELAAGPASGNPFALLGAVGFALVPAEAKPEDCPVLPMTFQTPGFPA